MGRFGSEVDADGPPRRAGAGRPSGGVLPASAAILRIGFGAIVALGSACAPSYRYVVTRPLATTGASTCEAHLVWNESHVRDVFLVLNGSGIGSNAFVHPVLEDLLATRPIAYATFDKPGIHAPFGDPVAVRRDYALLEHYTIGDGVACATDAIRWVVARFGPSVRVHLRAHSEGAIIALYLYEALLDRDPEAAATIATLVLSGVPLEPFDVILARQLDTAEWGAALRAAFAACDWTTLRERVGISCDYVADATGRASGRATFEHLASRHAPARFHVFHGTHDWHTPVAPVRALEAWNEADGNLDVAFHYYEGGHTGSDAARREMAALLASLVAE